MYLRLGDLLVKRGVLTEPQRDQILEQQRQSGRPFGVLAEQMFGVGQRDVENAWAEQYAQLVGTMDPRARTPERYALSLIDRRQAWQFGVLPLGYEGDELVLCTTQENLARAMRFAGWRIGQPTRFLLARAEHLAESLAAHFPMPGAGPETLRRGHAVA